MAYTEYRYDKEIIKALVEEKRLSLRQNTGFSNQLGFIVGVFRQRLAGDPRRYRDYGPYWPAAKAALNAAGANLGGQSDPLIAKTYRGDSDVETLFMADLFRTDSLKTNMLYTNSFMLDGDTGESWTLYDADMEEMQAH